jgi:Gentisate 1,2-dioxygenase
MARIDEELRARNNALNMIGAWEIIEALEAGESVQFKPEIWHWRDIRPIMIDAAKRITLADANRRVVILSNPGAKQRHHSTNTLYVSISIYNPGETAEVHRHTPNASRFVLEGDGGYTVVEGEKCTMSRGDLIITPAGTWHDHGNDGSAPVIWVDVLDLPLTESLGNVHFRTDYEERTSPDSARAEQRRLQTVVHPHDHSQNAYGFGGLMPTFLNHARGDSQGSSMFVYRWENTLRALNNLRQYEGSPYDGIMLEYINPVDGGPVTTTMGFNVQMLRPNEKTRAHRQTGSTSYCCIEGRGATVVDGKTMEWGRNDLFVIPSWAAHHHINASSTEDALLYSVTDIPALKKLGMYREEAAE